MVAANTQFCYFFHSDCMQYFTGTGGRFFSFNKENLLMQVQHYSVCMRQEVGKLTSFSPYYSAGLRIFSSLGYCKMQIDETRVDGSPDSFFVGVTPNGQVNLNLIFDNYVQVFIRF